MKRLLGATTAIMLLITPILANSASCTSIVKQLQTEFEKNPQKAKLPWSTLADINKALGKGSMVSTAKGITVYKWICPSNNNVYFSAEISADNRIQKASGIYSTDAGANYFTTGQMKNFVCEKVFKNIKDRHPALFTFSSNNPKHPDKIKIDWITDELGKPKVMKLTETLSVWDKYALFNGGSFNRYPAGKLPSGSAERKAAGVKLDEILGKPKHVYTDEKIQYLWNCPIKGKVIIRTTKDSKILMVNGSYQTSTGKNKVYGPERINKSDLHNQLDELAVEFKKAEEAQKIAKSNPPKPDPAAEKAKEEQQRKQQLSDYNQYFGTTLSSIEEIRDENIKLTKEYYKAVRNCTKGTYKYDAVSGYITANIEGLNKGSCIIKFTAINGVKRMQWNRHCTLSPADMATFTDEDAQEIGQGSYDSARGSEQTILRKCK